MLDHTLPLFSLQPETKEIPLTQGKVAVVDASDYEWLMQWKWHARRQDKKWYVSTYAIVDGERKMVLMHRMILGAPTQSIVDHKDGDGLNNRRQNIRLATSRQNNYNRKTRSDNVSGYKGVTFHKETGKWHSRIMVESKRKHLGLFSTIEEAAAAYDSAARELHGEFAWTNSG